jgi:hypothetical protein
MNRDPKDARVCGARFRGASTPGGAHDEAYGQGSADVFDGSETHVLILTWRPFPYPV